MDELFTRYMYYERACKGIKSSSTEALRKFYERDSYALLKKGETLENIIDLADFWKDITVQNVDRFSTRVLRELFVLNYAPNSMWTYFLSVYYLTNRDTEGKLDDDALYAFLKKTIAFVWAYAVTNPGVNALRTPIFAEMINVVNHQPVTFQTYLFDRAHVKNAFMNYVFSNSRAITKAMLTWWAFQYDEQELLSLETTLEIEHIFARNRQEKERSLRNVNNLESLGNKALLEKRVNIRASDYRFIDKKKYYTGFTNSRGQERKGTQIEELRKLASSAEDFSENDIIARHESMIDCFIAYLDLNGLIK